MHLSELFMRYWHIFCFSVICNWYLNLNLNLDPDYGWAFEPYHRHAERQTALFYSNKREPDFVVQPNVKEFFPLYYSKYLCPFAQLVECLGALSFLLFKSKNNTKQLEYFPYTNRFKTLSRSSSYYEKTICDTEMYLKTSTENRYWTNTFRSIDLLMPRCEKPLESNMLRVN